MEDVIDRAIKFLLNSFKEKNAWVDSSVIGTGHRGILYLQYPSYPVSFPVMALIRYQEIFRLKNEI